MPLTLTMENRGVAPPYAPYELRVKLSGAGDESWFACWRRAASRGCRARRSSSRYELALPADLKAGSYEVALGLFDVNRGKTRAVDFALKASARDSEGYYQLTKVPVTAARTADR